VHLFRRKTGGYFRQNGLNTAAGDADATNEHAMIDIHMGSTEAGNAMVAKVHDA
jgi:hypothetical protein